MAVRLLSISRTRLATQGMVCRVVCGGPTFFNWVLCLVKASGVMLDFKCGGLGLVFFFFWVAGVGFNVTPIRSSGVQGGGAGVAGTGRWDGHWTTRLLGVSVASRRQR